MANYDADFEKEVLARLSVLEARYDMLKDLLNDHLHQHEWLQRLWVATGLGVVVQLVLEVLKH